MFEKIKAFEQWMQENTFNGSQHALYTVIAILIAFFATASLFIMFITYIVMVVLFYFIEVWQAYSYDGWTLAKSFNITLYKHSKIEDIVAPIISGAILLGALSYVL